METISEARMLTNEELGAVIIFLRKLHQWSQETLAENMPNRWGIS